jgi:hypothetical protein
MHYDEPIVHIIFHKNAELGFPEIKELTVQSEKLSGNRPYLVLSDVRESMEVTPQGRKLAAEAHFAPLCRGSAVIVKNQLMQLATNFFVNLRKPNYPFRAFVDRESALKWLRTLSLD